MVDISVLGNLIGVEDASVKRDQPIAQLCDAAAEVAVREGDPTKARPAMRRLRDFRARHGSQCGVNKFDVTRPHRATGAIKSEDSRHEPAL
jgi:hypothetical protein